MYNNSLYSLKEFKTIDSTQNEIMNSQLNLLNSFVYFKTQEQTKGITRKQKKFWISRKNDLIFSLGFATRLKEDQIAFLNFVIAIEIIKHSKIKYQNKLKVKWPNDVYKNDKKIAGILINVVPNLDYKNVYIGVGINISKLWPSEKRISLVSEDGLFSAIVKRIKRLEKSFKGEVIQLKNEFLALDYWKNKKIIYENNIYKTSGLVDGGLLEIKNIKNEKKLIRTSQEIQYISK